MWKQRGKDELTTAEIGEALTQLRALGTTYLYLAGGEPLLRHDLPDIIQKARELKFKKIRLTSNALLLTREKAQTLLTRGLTGIDVSVNGTEAVHDMTRGVPGSYKKCIEALELLTELRQKEYPGLEINMITILMQPNLDQILKLANMCKQLNITLVLSPLDTASYLFQVDTPSLKVTEQEKLDQVMKELHKMRRFYPNLIGETHASLEYARKYFLDSRREDIPCYLGYLAVYIGAHGEVYSGCNVLPPVANFRDKPLKEIVSSTAYKKRLRDMFLKRCPGCPCGYRLNLYAHVPAVLDEALRDLWLRISSPKNRVHDESHE